MSRSRRLLAVLLSFATFLYGGPVFARINGSTTANTVTLPDIWCEGGSNLGTSNTATELCLDGNGHLTPTTDNVQKLGLSTLRYLDVETTNINSGNGALTVGSGNVTVPTAAGNTFANGTAGTANTAGSGNATAPSILAVNGTIAMTPSQIGLVSGPLAGQGIYASTTIPVNTDYELLLSSGGAILLTSTPQISTKTVAGSGVGVNDVTDGTILVVTSTDTKVITLQSNGLLSGSLLKLGATTRAITQYKVLTLMFQKTLGMWLEIAYGSDAN